MLYPIQETSEVQTTLFSSQNRRERQGNGDAIAESSNKGIRFHYFHSVQALYAWQYNGVSEIYINFVARTKGNRSIDEIRQQDIQVFLWETGRDTLTIWCYAPDSCAFPHCRLVFTESKI